MSAFASSTAMARLARALDEEHLARLTDRDKSTGWRVTSLLGRTEDADDRRYGNVPAEAFPFLWSGVDGCHYALWIDDPTADEEPMVVWVSPMDGTPETVQPVAPSAEAFLALVERAGLWLLADEHASLVQQSEDQSLAVRASRARYPTRDRMGVIAAAEPAIQRPDDAELTRWRDAPQAFRAGMDRLLDAGAPGAALAAARDLIADHDASGLEGFSERLATIYQALGRPQLATIALASYAFSCGVTVPRCDGRHRT